MRIVRASLAVLVVSTGLFIAACGSSKNCAGAATLTNVVFVTRGGGGGGGGHSSGFSGSHSSSGGRSSGAGTSGSRSNTFTNPVTHQSESVNIPTHVGSTYSYQGHSFSYHPESYWTGLGAPNPDNPYDTRNFNNPFSPFYHAQLTAAC